MKSQLPLGRRSFLAGGIGTAGLFLAGCAGSSQPTASGGQGAAGAMPSIAPQAVVDDRGKSVKLDVQPTRVSAVYDGLDVDNVVALGLVPVSTGIKPGTPERPRPWLDGKLDGSAYLDTNAGIPLEKLAELAPEVIISAYYDEKTYDKIEKIAPLYQIRNDQTWREQLTDIGRLLWREAEATAAAKVVDDAIAVAKSKVANRAGEQLAVISTFSGDASQVYQSTRNDGIGLALESLGFAPLAEPKEKDGVFNPISAERLDTIVGDRLVVIDFDYTESGPSATTTKLLASGLGRKIPAAKGGVVWMSKTATNASYLDTVLSQPFLVNELAEKLA